MIDVNIKHLFEKLGKRVTNYSYLGKGEASVVYKIETFSEIFVLKTALYPERKKKVLQEAMIRSYFIEKGLTCVPKPLLVDKEIFPNGAVVYEYIEGSKPFFDNKLLIQQMASILSSIHQIKYEVIEETMSNVQTLYDSLANTIHKIENSCAYLMNDFIYSAFAKALQEYSEMIATKNLFKQPRIQAQLHGDLSDNFIIDKKGSIWLIDWENSEFGDIIEELSWFLYVNNVPDNLRALFFNEYQKNFVLTQAMQLEELYQLYSATTPVFNICWGIDQLNTNIKYNLEPQRKITDLLKTTNEWTIFYSKQTSKLIQDGIELLAKKYYKLE